MKRHRPNASDTISKALLARKLVSGRKEAGTGPASRPASLVENPARNFEPETPGSAGADGSAQACAAAPADTGSLRPVARNGGGAPRAANSRTTGSSARARHYGLRSPLFRLRSYLYKLRGCQVYDSVPGPRDFIWSCIGSFTGIFILLQLDNMFFTGDQLLLLGSFGASCVIIFGAPHSPFAQPRSVIGGQVLSAMAGALVFTALGGYPMLAAPLSVTLAFAVMQLTKTMHPPGGATSLIAGSGQHIVQEMGVWYPLMPVGAGITLLFLIGLLINNLSRNRQYPLRWF